MSGCRSIISSVPGWGGITIGLEKPVAVEVRGTFVEIALGIDWAALTLQRPSLTEDPGEW